MDNLSPLGPDVKQHELQVNKETLHLLLRDMAQGISANKSDKKAQQAALALLSNVSPKEASKLLASIKQEYPVGIVETIKNVAWAMFGRPIQGSGAAHQAISEMERLVEGRERLIIAFRQHEPAEHILRVLALYPTSCEMLLESVRDVRGFDQEVFRAVGRFFKTATDLCNEHDPKAVMAAIAPLVNSTPEERNAIFFICKQILLPQVPQEQFQQVNRLVATLEGLINFLDAAASFSKNEYTLRMSTALTFALFSKIPELIPILRTELGKATAEMQENGIALLDFEHSLRIFLSALSADNAVGVNRAFGEMEPIMVKFQITDLKNIIQAIQKQDPKAVHNWHTTYDRLDLYDALNYLNGLPKIGGERALQAAGEIFQNYPPKPGSAMTTFYHALILNQELQELYVAIVQDSYANGNYNTSLLEPFQIAKEFYKCVLTSDLAAFKQTFNTHINRERIPNPNFRFHAVTAAIVALVAPTLPQELHSRLREYLNVAVRDYNP